MRPGQVHHPHPGGDQGGAALRAGEQRPHLGGVPRVVQQDEHPAAVQHRAVERRPFLQGVGDGGVRRAQRPQERAEYRLRLRGPRPGALEVDVQLAVGEGAARLVGHVHREGRLADAADPGQRRHGHDPALDRGQYVAELGDEGRPPGEVGDRRRELGGADRRGGRLGPRCRGFRQGWVGPQDALLEFTEAGAGVHAELVGQQAAGVGVDREGLGLASAAVQRQHQQLAQPLPQGVRRGQGGELGDRLRVAALLQVHVHPGFEELQAPLLQPHPLRLRVRARHPGQRLAVPQGQGPAQEVPGVAQVAGVPGLLRLRRQVLDDGQVEGALGQAADRVAAGLADQDAGVQHLAEPGGVRAQGRQCLRGGFLAPQGVDQLGGGGRAALAQQQGRQEGALLG